MHEVDWQAPRSLITNLKSNFPFIIAGEPAVWIIRDITDSNRPISRQFSPALMHTYNQFDAYLRNHGYSHHEPIDYTYWDESSNSWIIPDRKHISCNDLDLLEYAMAVPPDRNSTLMDIGLADANGHTKNKMIIDIARALVSSAIRKERELSSSPHGRNGFQSGKNKPYDRVDKRREGPTYGNGTPAGPQSPIINSPSTSTDTTLVPGNVVSTPTEITTTTDEVTVISGALLKISDRTDLNANPDVPNSTKSSTSSKNSPRNEKDAHANAGASDSTVTRVGTC